MRISHLHIKNFRCFNACDISFDNAITLIEGLNGTGKTSLLEALHYLCYMRSFRTHLPQEMVQFGAHAFFIKARIYGDESVTDAHELQVGFGNKKRLVKINNKAISSYKDLLHYYRIITMTQDDIALITGGPEIRRLYLDQFLILDDAESLHILKKAKTVVESRNAILKNNGSYESYQLWTEQLWQVSFLIQEKRIDLLHNLEYEIKQLVQNYFNNEFSIDFKYAAKRKLYESYDGFLQHNISLQAEEQRFGRSLFGLHLDDFTIQFKHIKSKNFASRGQQKLIVLLLKVAQIKLLAGHNRSPILLLDDFLTDFDVGKALILINLLVDLDIQLIFTTPTPDSFLKSELLKKGGVHLEIDKLNTIGI